MLDNDREAYLRLIESEALLAGRYVNAKRIDEHGGRGGFSLVFSALDQHTGRQVALKFYDPTKVGNFYRVAAYKREADFLSKFSGEPDMLEVIEPHTTTTISLETATVGSIPVRLEYHSTPLASGDLLDLIYDESATTTELLSAFRACCRAVRRLHASGIAHRDVKPENLLRFNDGIKFGDFRFARHVAAPVEPDPIEPSDTWKDHRYTAPELLFGVGDHPRALYLGDFYALGAILFEMFTLRALGTEIFDGELLSRLKQEAIYIPEENLIGWIRNASVRLTKVRNLPVLEPVWNRLPMELRPRIDRLYRMLAEVDYRRRSTKAEFVYVFIELDGADRFLKHANTVRQARGVPYEGIAATGEDLEA